MVKNQFAFGCRIVGSALAVGLSISGAGATAADAPIRLGALEFAPYYEMIDGKLSGPLADLLIQIWQHAGYSTTGEIFPPPRLVANLIEGRVQSSVLANDPMLAQSNAVLRSRDPVGELVLNLYSTGQPAPIGGREDLRGKTVAVVRGYSYGGLRAWMNQPENGVRVEEVNGVEAVVRMLASNRVTLALLYDINFETGSKAMGGQPTGVFENRFLRIPLYVYVNKNVAPDPQAVLDRLVAAHDDLLRRGMLNAAVAHPAPEAGKGG